MSFNTVKNGTESDVDCGGTCAAKCAENNMCVLGSDCVFGVCTLGLCKAPSCTDDLQNGSETDVDCGGSCAKKCEAAKKCSVPADCASFLCSTSGICSDIVTSGLVLHLDSGNASSYPGTGSSWKDLSGNGRDFTLNNPAHYSYDSGTRSIRFTRTVAPAAETGGYAEHTGAGSLTAPNYLYNDHTTEICARINNRMPTSYNGTESQGALLVYAGWHSMFYYSATSLNYLLWSTPSAGSAPPGLSLGTGSVDITEGQWFCAAVTRNGTSLATYINGTLKGVAAGAPTSSPGIVTNTIRIGMGNASNIDYSWHVDSNVGTVKFYNRALSATEIQQNFTAVRSRYGL